MSKKTIIFSIVLIIIATYFGSVILLDEETVTNAEKSHTLAEMATTKVAEEQMQQWIISSYDDIMQRIEESKRIAADIAAAHIMSKEWPCTIKDGRSYRTIYDAHMILQFGRAETMSTDSHARPMMIGSYPID